MNLVTGKNGTGTTGIVLIVVLALAVAACASGPMLKWNQVDAAALMSGPQGDQKMNAIRFATFGPRAEQIFGYFLYRDGIEVVTGEGIPLAKLGKKTLREVMVDYEEVKKSKMYTSGSNLLVREVLRGGSVVGYSASDLNMDVQLWDITKGDGPPVLRLVYKDLRRDYDSPDPARPHRR
jgi:hypothetical protein